MRRQRIGYIYGGAAYLCWGAFPVFFTLLGAVNPFELVPWRVLTALLFCLIAVTLLRGWPLITGILRSPHLLGWFALSSLLLYANWQFFVVGVVTGHIIETALGYFITPLVTILIGVFVRKERLNSVQWVAVGIAAIGVLISAIAYGQFPTIALGIALSFALYGAVRKQASEDIDALTGLTIETFFGSVLAVAQLVLLVLLLGRLSAFDFGPAVTMPLLLSGTVTAIPLLFFAAGTRRLPLSHMGFLQFITPVLSFVTGYFLFHEPMSAVRWIGFLAVWLALTVLVADMLMAMRRRASRSGGEDSVSAEARTGELPVQSGP